MSERWWIPLIILLGFALNSWSAPLFDLDEGAFSQATLEMIQSGNYVTTTLNGEPRYDKPMLSYWLQAASVRTFGEHEMAFRLPSLLAASLWLLLLYGFLKERETQPRQALIASAVLGLGLMSSVIGHAATADALLNLFIAWAGLEIFRWYEQPRRSVLMRVYLALALGLLTKGPVAVAIPGAASLLLFATQGRLRDWLRAIFDPLGWALLLALVLPWVYASYRYDQGEFLRHFLLDHNLGRYSKTLQSHGGHWWYYLAVLPLIVLPYTGLLRTALARAAIGGDALDRYCLFWFLLVLLLFSGSSTQLPHYLLYGCTPLFLLMGRHHSQVQWRRAALLPGLLLALALLSLPWLLPRLAAGSKRAYERGLLELATQQFHGLYPVFAALGVAALLYAIWIAPRRWRSALLIAGCVQALMLWGLAVPRFAQAYQEPTRSAALKARELALPTVSYRTYFPSFSVYRGAPTPEREPAVGELVFVRLDKLGKLREALPDAQLSPIYQSGGVALLLRLS